MTREDLHFTTPFYATKMNDDFLDTLSLETMDICIAKRELNNMKKNGIEVKLHENNSVILLESKMIHLLSAYLGKDEYFDVRAVEIDGNEYLIDNDNNVYYDTENFNTYRLYKESIIEQYFYFTKEGR